MVLNLCIATPWCTVSIYCCMNSEKLYVRFLTIFSFWVIVKKLFSLLLYLKYFLELMPIYHNTNIMTFAVTLGLNCKNFVMVQSSSYIPFSLCLDIKRLKIQGFCKYFFFKVFLDIIPIYLNRCCLLSLPKQQLYETKTVEGYSNTLC